MGGLSNKYVVITESVGGAWWITPDGAGTNDALLAGVFDEAKARALAAATPGFLARPACEVLCGPAGSLGEALRLGLTSEPIVEEIVDLKSEEDETQRAVREGFAALQHARATGEMPPGYEAWDDEGDRDLLVGVGSTPEQAADTTSGNIDPTVAALAVVDDMVDRYVELSTPAGRRSLAERLAKVIAGAHSGSLTVSGGKAFLRAVQRGMQMVDDRDTKPSNSGHPALPHLRAALAAWSFEDQRGCSAAKGIAGTGELSDMIAYLEAAAPAHAFPLWCAFESDRDVERPFHGPYETEAAAESAAVELRAEGREATIRRCRRVRASECVRMKWQIERIVDEIQDDPGGGKVGESGVYVLGGFDVPWARVCKDADESALDSAIDTLIEIEAFEVEPEGAAP